MLAALRRDLSVPAVVAGFVAVLVGYSSSVAIVFQAARAVGAGPQETASWMWALGIAMGITCMGLSMRWRLPVLTAWSTPGAALIAATHGITLPQAVGAFMVCALLIVLAGATRLFERLMDRVPMAVAAALLAGVLTRFGLDAVQAAGHAPALVLPMLLAYLACRRFAARWAVPVVLLVGIMLAALQGRIDAVPVAWSWAMPVAVMPEWSWRAVVGMGLPLFIVTMASQNLPGVAAQRAAGFGHTPISPVITTTGLVTLVLAPFGAFAINLAAITAAICMAPEAHPDPARRWVAPVMAGVFYTLLGISGGVVAGLLGALPHEVVAAVAGLALLSTIAGGLATALADVPHRDAAALTFLVTLSGIAPWGIGSAFWGTLAGLAALLITNRRA